MPVRKIGRTQTIAQTLQPVNSWMLILASRALAMRRFLKRHPQVRHFAQVLWQHRRTFWCAMAAHSKPFVVARNQEIAPKQRRVERIPPGYAVREFYNDSQGRFWYVVTTLEVIAPTKRLRGRT